MKCGIMVYKMILFSWKAASENNLCNLGKTVQRNTALSLKSSYFVVFDHFTSYDKYVWIYNKNSIKGQVLY